MFMRRIDFIAFDGNPRSVGTISPRLCNVLLYSRISITVLEFSPLSLFFHEKKEDRENDRDSRRKGRAVSRPRLSCSFPADIKDRSA